VHAYLCEFDDGAILLDLRSDTYLGIDVQHLSNLRACIGNWPDSDRSDRAVEHHDVSASESLLVDLLARGILTTTPTCRQSPPALNPTTALTLSSSERTRSRIALTHIAQFSIALLVVMSRLRKNRFPALLDWLRQRQSSIHCGNSVPQEEIVERLASFLRLRIWCYTARQRCLFDSLVLTVYLTKAKIPCTFVIGVASKPFLAHSWVQIGHSVLNDTAEHAQDFKIILSIGGK
jgi:Transglutaminase-like superfamily